MKVVIIGGGPFTAGQLDEATRELLHRMGVGCDAVQVNIDCKGGPLTGDELNAALRAASIQSATVLVGEHVGSPKRDKAAKAEAKRARKEQIRRNGGKK